MTNFKQRLSNHKYLFIVLFVLLICLQLNNTIRYDYNRGFDAGAHLSYINYLKTNHSLPLPHKDFGFYHPPLYYVLASFFKNPASLKFVGLFLWLSITSLGYLLFKRLLRDNFLIYLGTLLLSSTPVVLYITPNITNEFLFAFLCLIFFYVYIVKKNYWLTGIILALMFLTKSTAIIILVSLFINEIICSRKSKYFIKNILLILVPVIIISGWFYLRNYFLYQKIFFINLDLPQLASRMPKEDRGLGFIFNLKPFLTLDLFQAQHKSLIAGTYFSWFYDGHNNIVPIQAFSKIGVLCVLMSLPIFIFTVIGSIKNFKKKEARFFVIYSLIFIVSYFFFNLRYPYYSSVKGSYLLGLIFPATYFLIKGVEKIKNKQILFGYLLIYTLVIIKAFWLRS